MADRYPGRFCWGGGVAVDAAPLADEGTVIVGVSVLMDTGIELPAELLKPVRVTEDWLSIDVDVDDDVNALTRTNIQ